MYEGRWKTRELAPLRARFAAPVWQGEEDIRDKRLLVYAEQGHGDTLQFCRYLPRLLSQCAQLAVEVQPSLIALLKPAFPGVNFVAGGEPLPEHDRCCGLMSLPLVFGTRLETIPAVVPVHAPGDGVNEWSWILGEPRVPRVGLAWRGSPRHTQDARRSLAFTELIGLLDMPLEFHCLHVEPMPPESDGTSIRWWGNQLRSFSDTAGLIHHMDLVISVDTAVAHVAASMGKPTWIILSSLPDFRWLLEREDSPWYPSVRLFRQDSEGQWRGVVERLRHETIRHFSLK